MPRPREPGTAPRRSPSPAPLTGITEHQAGLLLERLQQAQREIGRMHSTLDELARAVRRDTRPAVVPAAPAARPALAPAAGTARRADVRRGGWDSR